MNKKMEIFCLLAAILIPPSTGMSQSPVRWEATVENAQRLAGQTNRLVLIEFCAPWCAVCKRMDNDVLTQPSVATELNTDYVPVKINADQFPVTATRYGVTHLPTTVVLSPSGQTLDSIEGWMETDQYVARLSRVAADIKQRQAVYAQVPAVPTPSVSSQSSPNKSPPGPLSAQPPSMSAVMRPANTSPPPTGVTSFGSPNYVQVPAPIASPSPAGPSTTSGGSVPVYGTQSALAQSTQPAMTQSAQPAFPQGIASQPTAPRSTLGAPPALTQSFMPVPAQGITTMPTSSMPSVSGYGTPSAPVYGAQPSAPLGSPQSSPTPQVLPGNPPLGLDGFCPVSLCERQKWLRGDPRWGVIHHGRTYLFTGPNEQQRFLAYPDRYAPVVSGNDVVLATDQGRMVPGSREHGVFYGPQVYLFASEDSLAKFIQNPNVYARQTMDSLRSGNSSGIPLR